MNKKIVICDTNIWYHLSKGDVALHKDKFEYYATTANLVDFYSSEKISRNRGDVDKLKQAILALENNADFKLFLDPTTEARRLLYGINSFEEEIQLIGNDYNELLRYARGETDIIHGPAIQSMLKAKSNFQELVLNFKSQFTSLFGKNNKYNSHEKMIVKGNIVNYLHENFERMNLFSVDIKNIDWSKISVFIDVFCEFIEKSNNTIKPNKNSLIDLYMLFYIGDKEKLFWTKENKINNKILDCYSEKEVLNILYERHLNNN